MKKHTDRKKLKRIGIRVLAVLGTVAAAVLIFLGVFYVPDQNASVVGNTRYTADEIREMVFTDFASRNAIYLTRFVKTVQPENAPFVRSIEIAYDAHNRVTLQVNENNPIGYVRQDGYDYYFDAKGYVLEAFPAGTGSGTASDGTATADQAVNTSSPDQTVSAASSDQVTGAATPDQTESTVSADQTVSAASAGRAVSAASAGQTTGNSSPGAATENGTADQNVSAASAAAGALQADMVHTSDTEFHPALTDVTEVKGLTDAKLSVGAVIAPADPGVFSTLLAITKIVSKLDIIPDSIEIQNGNQFVLHYGDILIDIGQDTLLEEKMSRAAAILPQLSGMKGTLHLENFSEDTVNIIFDQDEETGTDSTSEASGADSADASGTDSTGTENASGTDGTISYGTDDASGYGTDSTGTGDTYGADGTDAYGTDDASGYGTDGTGTGDTYGTDGTDAYGTDDASGYGTDGTGTDGTDTGCGDTDSAGTDESGTDSGNAVSRYEYQP